MLLLQVLSEFWDTYVLHFASHEGTGVLKCTYKIVYKGPVEHATHIKAVPHCSLNLQEHETFETYIASALVGVCC